MKVLYLSKALVAAAHRDKITALAAHAEVTAVVPPRWGRFRAEASTEAGPHIRWERAWLSGSNHLHVYPRIGAILDDVRPDIVHVDEEPYSAVTWHVVRHCAARDIPCLFFAWQNIAKQLPPPFHAMRRWVFRNVSGAIAGTPHACETLRTLGYDRPAAVIPQFGVDPSRFRPDRAERRQIRATWGVADERFVAGYLGRLVPEKGVATLVEAVARLSDLDLVVVGEGPERRRLAAMARRLGCEARVRFAGAVPSLEAHRVVRALDVLVLPSRETRRWREQFGRVLVEAMAASVPVVATRTGSIPWVVGGAAELVQPDAPGRLAEAVDRVARDAEHRNELASRGREIVRTRFTTAAIAAQTLDWYGVVTGALNPAMIAQ